MARRFGWVRGCLVLWIQSLLIRSMTAVRWVVHAASLRPAAVAQRLHALGPVIALAVVAVVQIAACRCDRPAPSREVASSVAPAPSVPPPEPFVIDGLEKLTHRPLAVLYQFRAWSRVIDSNVPAVTVYEDGLVVIHRARDDRPERLTGNLTPDAALELARQIDDHLARLPAWTDASHASDQLTTWVLARTNRGWRAAGCYGCFVIGAADGKLLTLTPPGQRPWEPEHVKIRLDPAGNERSSPPWPSVLPEPPADAAPDPDGVIRYLVAARYEADFQAFSRSSVRGTAALRGRAWFISHRILVPEEDYIHRVLTCARGRLRGARPELPPECR